MSRPRGAAGLARTQPVVRSAQPARAKPLVWGVVGCALLGLWLVLQLTQPGTARAAGARGVVAAPSGVSPAPQVGLGSPPVGTGQAGAAARRDGCPVEMLRVGRFCIDRWEVSTQDAQGRPLSPFYPPDHRILNKIRKVWVIEQPRTGPLRARAFPMPALPEWQRRAFKPVAVSAPGVVPQGYMSYHMARAACQNAGKRLCQDEEWELACRGAANTKFPYGDDYVAGKCNVFREFHPADVLHSDASSGHRDPRLNLILENGKDPGLRDTGATPTCDSRWPRGNVSDMVGNLDEWVADPKGRFRGGFYSRNSRAGCDAKVTSHPAGYFDYSTGARCCADPK